MGAYYTIWKMYPNNWVIILRQVQDLINDPAFPDYRSMMFEKYDNGDFVRQRDMLYFLHHRLNEWLRAYDVNVRVVI